MVLFFLLLSELVERLIEICVTTLSSDLRIHREREEEREDN